MKKVLIITYYWPPSGGPGVQRHLKLTKYLPENNIEPVVVTVNPDKASYPLMDSSLLSEVNPELKVFKTDTFEILNIYSAFFTRGKLPKPGFSDDDSGIIKMIAKYIRGNFFIPDARIGWNRYALTKCRELLREHKISTIITSSPPHSTQLIGLQLNREFGVPWIADLRDPWTDIYYNRNLYRSKLAKKKDQSLEISVLENATAILTVSESFKKLFQSKSTKIDPNKIYVIPNGFDPADFANKPESSSNEFVISYVGTMSKQYPVASFINALRKLVESYSANNIRLHFIGQISDQVMSQFEEAGLSNIMIRKRYVEHNEAIKNMHQSSVLLLIIPDVKNNEGILPGKLFEYLASRRPVMIFGPKNSDASRILSESNSGKSFEYHDSLSAFSWLEERYKLHQVKSDLTTGNEKVASFSRDKQARLLAGLIYQISN